MNFLSCLFSVFCSLILPVGAAILICLRQKGLLRSVLLGAATFTLFQLLLRLPLLQFVLAKMDWFMILSMTQPLMYSLFLGFTAGLFEEFGRYIVMRLFLKERLSTLSGVAFGIGHGGIEAVLLVGINALVLLFAPALAAVPPSMMFAGGLERVSTLLLHVGWSVMVMKSVRERKLVWLAAAFFAHGLIDTLAAYAAYLGLSVWVIELVLLLCALTAPVFIIKELRKDKKA